MSVDPKPPKESLKSELLAVSILALVSALGLGFGLWLISFVKDKALGEYFFDILWGFLTLLSWANKLLRLLGLQD